MEIKDIIALANAGFTAAQITALANAQQMQAQQMPQMQAQQMPQMQAQQMPQMQAQQMPQMQAQQMPQMQAQQMPQMQAQQMPAVDPVLEQLKQLTGIVQNGNIMAASQPAVRNADDIIGTIINPPATDKG